MGTPASWPVAKSFIGTKKEVTQGTAVPPLAITVPVNKFTASDKFEPLKDKAQRGDMAGTYGQQQGAGSVEWSIDESPAFYDTLPIFLYNILGDIATTGAGPYVHTIALLNSGDGQPGTVSIFDWQGTPANKGRQYPGIVVTELTLKGNPENEYITWSAKGLGWLSAITAAEPVAAASSDQPMAAWRVQVQVNGADVDVFGEWEITLTREGEAEHTSQNSQQPYKIQRGALTCTGSIRVKKPSDETQYGYFLANTQPHLGFLADNGGATTALRSINIDLGQVAFDTAELDRGELAIGYNMAFEAIANASNAGASLGTSPIKVVVTNNSIGSTYV